MTYQIWDGITLETLSLREHEEPATYARVKNHDADILVLIKLTF